MPSPRQSPCQLCLHYRGKVDYLVSPTRGEWAPDVCDAFPWYIPHEVWTGELDHRRPVEGDNGIQFEPRPGAEPDRGGSVEEYLADFYGPEE